MPPAIIQLKEILHIIDNIDVVRSMEVGFVAYSNGKAVVPPVGELLFENPKGETHIKYGYIKGADFYCIKIASGFYNNPSLGIASNQGMMLLFSQNTGEPKAILLDEGHLTDVRTAAAGALVARYFSPEKVNGIGIIGTGVQARLQLEYLLKDQTCKNIWIWGRNSEKAKAFMEEMPADLDVHTAKTTADLARHCNLIVTTTPSCQPLLFAEDVLPGTHITAIGSDTAEKQELDTKLLQKADLVISDSLPQSRSRGEIFKAVQDGCIHPDQVVELGDAIRNPALQRTNNQQITVADLTGVAVQDIMISKEVFEGILKKK